MGSQDDYSLTLHEKFLQEKSEDSQLSTGDGSIDLYGKPAQKNKTGSWKACLFILGMCALTLSASVPALIPDECVTEFCPSATPVQNSVFFFGLYVIALGIGGIQPCLPPFGADQLDSTDTTERIMKGSFFNWYLFSVCFGSLVAISVFVWIQENIGWGIGYGIPTVFMGISLASILSGSPFYRFQKSGVCKSPVTSICQVIVASVRKCRLDVPQQSSLLHETQDIGTDQKLEHTERLEFLDKAAILTKLLQPS